MTVHIIGTGGAVCAALDPENLGKPELELRITVFEYILFVKFNYLVLWRNPLILFIFIIWRMTVLECVFFLKCNDLVLWRNPLILFIFTIW